MKSNHFTFLLHLILFLELLKKESLLVRLIVAAWNSALWSYFLDFFITGFIFNRFAIIHQP